MNTGLKTRTLALLTSIPATRLSWSRLCFILFAAAHAPCRTCALTIIPTFDARITAYTQATTIEAEVVLIEQTRDDVPTAPADLPQFYTDLKAGVYGRVVETIIGPQNENLDLTVRWDLRRHRGKKMRLLVIDWLDGSWGFITVSEVTRFFVNRTEPVNIYVDRSNTLGPFLGTPGYPFQTVTDGYNAATDSVCSVNILKIHAGDYPETLAMNKPVTLNAE